jgi:hypothetical protein
VTRNITTADAANSTMPGITNRDGRRSRPGLDARVSW